MVWVYVGVSIYCFIYSVLLFKQEVPNNSQQNSQRQPSISPSNENINNSSSTNVSLRSIQWTEIRASSSTNSQSTQQNNIKFDDLIAINHSTANTEELIRKLIGQKDRVTSEIFNAGEKVYFCVPCQLGYHEDSWQFLDQKCDQCKSSNVNMYTLRVHKVNQQPMSGELIQFYNLKTPTSNRVKQISALDLETIIRNIGNIVLIEGRIRKVRVDKNNHIIYFDFAENTYQGFFAYVICDKCKDFPIPINYEGKNVILSGRLTLNSRNQPRIRLDKGSQLTEV